MHIGFFEKILSNKATREEFTLHEEKLNDEAYKSEFHKYKTIWEASDMAFSRFDKNTFTAWENVRSKTIDKKDVKLITKHKRKPIAWYKWAAVFVALLGFMALIKIIIDPVSINIDKTYICADDIKLVTLKDGTKVWIKENSKLMILKGYGSKNRNVILEGEAYFNVEKNKNLTFEVQNNDIITKVLGTKFNVMENNNDITVNVVSGKVMMFHKKSNSDISPIILEKGDKGKYTHETKKLIKHNKTDLNFLSWKTKKIRFKDTPMSEICEHLSHDFNIEVNYIGEKLDSAKLTASFEDKSLSEILEVISLTLDAKVIHKDDNHIVIVKE